MSCHFLVKASVMLGLGFHVKPQMPDGSVTLWDLAAREEVFRLRCRSLPITQLAFDQGGRFLLVGDGGMTIVSIDRPRPQQ